MTDGSAPTWIQCNGYRLIVHDAKQARPKTEFDLTVWGNDGTVYAHDRVTNKDPALFNRILRVLGHRWPDRELEIQADTNRVITDIRCQRNSDADEI